MERLSLNVGTDAGKYFTPFPPGDGARTVGYWIIHDGLIGNYGRETWISVL